MANVSLFADVNSNLIDGSTIWLQSMALALHEVPHTDLTVLLRDPAPNSPILAPLVDRKINLVTIMPDLERPLDSKSIGRALEERLNDNGDSLVIVRGDAVLDLLSQTGEECRSRIWPYWLRRPDLVSPWQDEFAFRIFDKFPKIIVQSLAHKSVLESLYRQPAAKILAIPPMVPDDFWQISHSKDDSLLLVYSGKMDSDYNVENYLTLVDELNADGTKCRLRVIGDKFNADHDDKLFVKRMRNALQESAHVEWLGGMDRYQAAAKAAEASLGLCVRKAKYDKSLEISTKLVEFCALGVPPLVNRTRAHTEFLGSEYPFYADSVEEARSQIKKAAADLGLVKRTAKELRNRAQDFSLSHQSQRLTSAIRKSNILNRKDSADCRITKVLVIGHDFKFIDDVVRSLGVNPRISVDEDLWPSTNKHDERDSLRKLRWADVVFCEWCAGAAVWSSHNVQDGQRLIVRLHRFELTTEFPGRVDFSKVDRLIVVRSEIKRMCIEKYHVPPEKIDVIPQFVDWQELCRPKHSGADRTLGLVGINPYDIKRPDRAVDLLERLLDHDDRWKLRVRSVMPWDISWTWSEHQEREKFRGLFTRIRNNGDLSSRIVFDPAGPDMAEWYRHIGYILSTSSLEGCHTAVAEGMASGAVPVLIDWEGADTVYPPRFVSSSIDGMAAIIRRHLDAVSTDGTLATIAETSKKLDIQNTIDHLVALCTASDLAEVPLLGWGVSSS